MERHNLFDCTVQEFNKLKINSMGILKELLSTFDLILLNV